MATLKTYALTTLADVKESLGIPSSNTQYDNLIIRKINMATAMIENYCGRRFKATDYTNELYNGSQSNQIVLRQRPVIGVVTLNQRDTTLNEDHFNAVDSEIFFTEANSGIIDLLFNGGGNWGSYAISYRAGYEDIPDDLAEAAATLASYLVGNADGGNVAVASKREGGRQINYASASVSFERILENLGINSVVDSYANTPLFADK